MRSQRDDCRGKMGATMSEEETVKPGDRFKNGDLLIEVLETPYINRVGKRFCMARILESKGFEDPAQTQVKTRLSVDSLLNHFDRAE